MRQVGDALLAPHMGAKRVKRLFGDMCDVNGWEDLVKVEKKRVLVGGDDGLGPAARVGVR